MDRDESRQGCSFHTDERRILDRDLVMFEWRLHTQPARNDDALHVLIEIRTLLTLAENGEFS